MSARALFVLPYFVGAQRRDGIVREGNAAPATLRLGLAEGWLLRLYLHHRLPDLELAGGRVDMLPRQPEQLPLAHARVRRHRPERPQAIHSPARRRQQASDLVAGRPVRFLVGYRRRGGAIGHVDGDVALIDRLGRRPVEVGVDVVHRVRRGGQQDWAQRRPAL